MKFLRKATSRATVTVHHEEIDVMQICFDYKLQYKCDDHTFGNGTHYLITGPSIWWQDKTFDDQIFGDQTFDDWTLDDQTFAEQIFDGQTLDDQAFDDYQ